MECMKIINGIPTPCITYGRGLDDNLENVKYIVVLFTGNPGVIQFYNDFMKTLHTNLKVCLPSMVIPIWGIAHAGHQLHNARDLMLLPSISENPECYDIDGQIEHKRKFLELFVPEHIKIIGIGHSVGTKIWIELTKRYPKLVLQIRQCYLLFPTIERLAETPRGKILKKLEFLGHFVPYFTVPFFCLPATIQNYLVKIPSYFSQKMNMTPSMCKGINGLNAEMIKRWIVMGKSQLQNTLALDRVDIEAITKNVDKFFFYFGTTDQFCPLEFADDMENNIPGLRFKICDKGLQHTFFLFDQVEMPRFICDLITNNLIS